MKRKWMFLSLLMAILVCLPFFALAEAAGGFQMQASLSAGTVEVGNKLTVTVNVSGGKAPYAYTYRWFVTDPDGENEQQISGIFSSSSASNTQTIEFGHKGYVAVWAEDAKGQEQYKRLDFTITGNTFPPLTAEVSLSADTVEVGNSLTVTVNASGGKKPYTYSYIWTLMDPHGENEQEISRKLRLPEASNTQTINFGAHGYVDAIVNDAAGRYLRKRIYFNVTGDTFPPLSGEASLSAVTVEAGNSLTIAMNAKGGKKPYTYSYGWYVTSGTEGSNQYIGGKPNSSEASHTQIIEFGRKGFVYVRVKDANGRVIQRNFEFTITGDVSYSMEASLSAVTVEVGNQLTVTVDVKGGKPPYVYRYNWLVMEENGENCTWFGAKSNSSEKSYAQTIPFGKKGLVHVTVKDAEGRELEKKPLFTITGRANGWIQVGWDWYYYEDDKRVKGWLYVNNTWYYMDASGIMVTGEVEIDGVVHVFGENGAWQGQKPQKEGWEYENGSWYYYKDGKKVTGWLNVSGTWYYLDANGVMQTGWLYLGGTWYYLNASGAMVTGEVEIDGVVHVFGENGAWLGVKPQKDGWEYENGSWYYYKDGKKVTGWLGVSGTWYYLDANGVMQTGWLYLDGTWYYLNASGAMVTGWLNLGGTWYYFRSSGAMVTGEVEIDGVVHVFSASGAWLGRK